MNTKIATPPGVEILGTRNLQTDEILTPEATKFVVDLERRFGSRRRELLAARVQRQARLDAGEKPDFLPQTAEIRNSDWKVAPLPADLLDRRVEITGPVDRKMIINALNSGASVFMADFEDSITPSWGNVIDGQHNLRDAVRRTIAYTDSKTRQIVRSERPDCGAAGASPRMASCRRSTCLSTDEPMSGSLFDFGLFFWHNVKEQLARGTGPYFYLPKMESHLEARLWNDVFLYSQEVLGVQHGTIRAPCSSKRSSPRLKWTKFCMSCANIPRAQLRPVGLYLQLHQEVRKRSEHSAARPCARYHDHALPALLQQAAHQDVPPSRSTCNGRHGSVYPEQKRSGGKSNSHGKGSRG